MSGEYSLSKHLNVSKFRPSLPAISKSMLKFATVLKKLVQLIWVANIFSRIRSVFCL